MAVLVKIVTMDFDRMGRRVFYKEKVAVTVYGYVGINVLGFDWM